MLIEFTKMHGLGNDFMVIDLVTQRLDLTKELVELLGCLLYTSPSPRDS